MLHRVSHVFLIFIFFSLTSALCSDNSPYPPLAKGGKGGFVSSEINQKSNPHLSKTHILKLKRIAEIITSEIIKRNIKTVKVEDFTDIKGRHSPIGTKMREEFVKQLMFIGKTNFNIVNNGSDVIIRGILIPYKEGGKWRLEIKVISSDTGQIITSYAGIFKKLKSVRR